MISPNIERWKMYFGNSNITRARHVLGELKVDFVNRIFKNQCIDMQMKTLLTDFYLKRETATNSLFWVIMGEFYPLLWSIFFVLATK